MKRVGSCKACGACCKLLGFYVDLSVPGAVDFYRARGLDIREDGLVSFEHPCPHLTAEGKCDLQGTSEKPQSCVDWPRSPHELLPGCGFRFE